MKRNTRHILILFVDLILSSVIIDFAMLGYSEPDSAFGTFQEQSFSELAVDLPSITEDFTSVEVPQTETECSPSERLLFHYFLPVLPIKGRSPPYNLSLQPTSWPDLT